MGHTISGIRSNDLNALRDIRFVAATEADLTRMHELINYPEMFRYSNILFPVKRDQTRAFFNMAQTKGFFVWCLKLPDTGMTGVASLILEDPSTTFGRNTRFAL